MDGITLFSLRFVEAKQFPPPPQSVYKQIKIVLKMKYSDSKNLTISLIQEYSDCKNLTISLIYVSRVKRHFLKCLRSVILLNLM